jgi:aryl-phospho-beta-D-glucosidase BglC (GH1 family)
MKRIAIAVSLAVSVYVGAIKAPTPIQPTSGNGKTELMKSEIAMWLHKDGRWLKDENGKIVTLRGVNTFIRQQNEKPKYVAIKAAGANVVRLMISAYDTTTPALLAGLDNVIAWCREAGLMVILDMQIGLKGPKGVEMDLRDILRNPKTQAIWLSVLGILVDRYKSESTVVGLDVMNEPWDNSLRDSSGIDWQGEWEILAKKAVADLRPINLKLLLVVSGWGMQTDPACRDIAFYQGSNIVYTDHI